MRGGRTRAGVESQDCLCRVRGRQTDMYLSTVRDTVMYTDITRLVCTLRDVTSRIYVFNYFRKELKMSFDMNPLTWASGKVMGTVWG